MEVVPEHLSDHGLHLVLHGPHGQGPQVRPHLTHQAVNPLCPLSLGELDPGRQLDPGLEITLH